jgi:hypothetical protein
MITMRRIWRHLLVRIDPTSSALDSSRTVVKTYKEMWRGLGFVSAACAVVGCTPDGADGPRDIPVRLERTNKDGTMRFFVSIEMGGGKAFDALLDTGSSGLRILPQAHVADDLQTTTAIAVSASFHSGLMLEGTVAQGRVTIGDLQTDAIPVMMIEQVSCTSTDPCPATGKTLDEFSFDGAAAILGIGMRNSASTQGIANPIAQLAGHPAYIVQAPAYGGTHGVLRVQPSALDRAAFVTTPLPSLADGQPLPDGSPTWDDRGVQTCVTGDTLTQPFCAGALLDTGAPPVELDSQLHTGPATTFPPGTHFDIQIGDGGVLGSMDFTVGATPAPGVDKVVLESRANGDFINLGTSVFFHFDVLFDQHNGLIGLAPMAAQ